MANSFLDRNKKKSSGGLVLLLTWLRGRGPLIVLLVAVMGIFIAPSNFVGGITDSLYRSPWGRPLARALSLATGRPAPLSYADMVKQLREARQQTNRNAWSLFSRGGGSNADSLGLVLGGARDVLGAASIASKIQGGKTINGVLSPEDSRKNGANGVELTNADLQGGFVASAAAGVFPGQNLLTGGRVAPATPQSSMASAMQQARVPVSDEEKMIAGREGRMSKSEFRTLELNKLNFDQHHSNVGMPGSALYTLADARTRGQMSRAPTCTDENGCPPEYANTNSGAVYDGNKAGQGKVIQASAVYGFDGASTPGLIKDQAADQDELEKIKADQRACDEADATYKPLLNPHVKRMIELSKMPRLPEIINEQRSECRILDQLLHQQYDACPLRHEDGPYEPQECD